MIYWEFQRVSTSIALNWKHEQYRMNPNYASIVKKDIDKLLDAGFIVPVEIATRCLQ